MSIFIFILISSFMITSVIMRSRNVSDGDMPQFFYLVFLIAVFLHLFFFLSFITVILFNQKFGYQYESVIPREELPPEVLQKLTPGINELNDLKFKVLGFSYLEGVANGWSATLKEQGGYVYASVSYYFSLDKVTITLLNMFSDDTLLATTAGMPNLPQLLPQDVILNSLPEMTLRKQIERHLKTLTKLRKNSAKIITQQLSLEEMISSYQQKYNNYIDNLVQKGLLLKTEEPGKFRPSLWFASGISIALVFYLPQM